MNAQRKERPTAVLNIHIDADLHHKLKAAAEADDRSVRSYVERLIAAHLAGIKIKPPAAGS